MTVPSEPARDRPHAGCQRVVVGEANVQPLPCPIGMPPAASHTRPLAPPQASLGWRHHGHCHAPAEHVLGVPVGGASSDGPHHLDLRVLEVELLSDTTALECRVARDRKSVVKGKSGSVRVDCGGWRIIKKKTEK